MKIARVNTEMALESFKRNSKLFQLLDHEGIATLAGVATSFLVSPGTVVVRQGAKSDSFFLISKGGVRVLVENAQDSKEVARLGAGSFFGEMGVFTGEARSATVMTIGQSVLIRFPGKEVLDFLENYPTIKEVLGMVGAQRTMENLQQK